MLSLGVIQLTAATPVLSVPNWHQVLMWSIPPRVLLQRKKPMEVSSLGVVPLEAVTPVLSVLNSHQVDVVYSTLLGGFAAKKADGSAVTWGSSSYGGDSSSVDLCPTASTPVVSVQGDPVTFFGERRIEFDLPPCFSTLIKTPDLEIRAKPLNGSLGEQWIGHLASYRNVQRSGKVLAMISIKPDIVMFLASGKFVPGDFATLDVTLPGHPMPLRQIPASSFDMGTISMAFKALPYFDKMAGSPPREIAVVHSRFINFMVISTTTGP